MSIALLLGIFFLLLIFGILVKVFRRVWAAFLTIIILAALAGLAYVFRKYGRR